MYIFTSQTLSRVSPRKCRGVAEKVTFANALGRSAMAVRGLFGVVGGSGEDQAAFIWGRKGDFLKKFGKQIGS